MKKLEFLNFQFSYQLKRKEFKESDYYSNETMLKAKILYIIFLISAIVFSNNLELFKNAGIYLEGDVLKKDIYASKTVIFHDEIARDKMIEKMLATQGKEYIFVSGVDGEVLENYDKFKTLIEDYRKRGELEGFKDLKKSTGIELTPKNIERYQKLTDEQLYRKLEKGREIIQEIYKKGVFKEGEKISINEEIESRMKKEFSEEEVKFIKNFIKPNYIFDREKTKSTIKEKIEKIKREKSKINVGDLVLKKGKVLTENDIKYMNIVGVYAYRHVLIKMFFNGLYLIGISIIFYQYSIKRAKEYYLNRNKYRAQFIMTLILFLSYRFIDKDLNYFIPLNAFVFLGMVLYKERYALSKATFTLLYILPFFDYDLKFLVVSLISLIVLGLTIKKIQTRIELVHLGIKIGVLSALGYLLLSYFLSELYKEEYIKSLEILGSSSISGMIAIALLPYFERTFNIMTTFRLLELADLTNPLLKEFSIIAPGTFQHSLMVATLSENAAEKIGADSIFARVASYYHDVGKMKRSHYYVENLNPGENPHRDLSPNMSVTIIKAHTKDGVEIGKKHGLPKEIRDVMLEHQGTTLIAYFYNRAKQEDENVNPGDFRYPGPIPKSKESAIIMLADSIEAAVRSLDEKTQDNVEKLIRKIIAGKIEDGQLTDADLTFREIEVIIQSFKKTLTSIHHIRVKYPELEKK